MFLLFQPPELSALFHLESSGYIESKVNVLLVKTQGCEKTRWLLLVTKYDKIGK